MRDLKKSEFSFSLSLGGCVRALSSWMLVLAGVLIPLSPGIHLK
jgi:hypothetical protein